MIRTEIRQDGSRWKNGSRWIGLITLLISTLLISTVLGTGLQAAPPKEITDQMISDKVEDELIYDPGVTGSRVDVETASGIVTLTGTVSNILASERAGRIAETVKGVRAVVNRIDVNPSVLRSDDEIQQDIEIALRDDPATDSYEVTASVTGGVVTLVGNVDSYQERELVGTVAKGVRGVTGIENDVVVRYNADRADNEIKHEIKQALRWNLHVDDHLIHVVVQDGNVALSGTVGSAAERRIAKYGAWVAGVKSVDVSKLSVEGWARDPLRRGDKFMVKSASELQRAVKDALRLDPRVNSLDVDVETSASVVTLRGTVDNLKAKRAAKEDAANTVGVAYVHNRLKVRLPEPPADDAVEQAIRDAWARDPYVERFEVAVAVLDGIAHLYGTVDSRFEKNRVDELASRVSGVIDVENHLNVDDQRNRVPDPYVDHGYVNQNDWFAYERRAPFKTDAQIQESIESELWWSPFVNSDQVEVSVDRGVAVLTGTVDSWGERRKATENAYEGSATLVDNDLLVESH